MSSTKTLSAIVDDDTIYGTAGDDNLVGSDFDDVLVGMSGNDILNGGKGNDLLSGGKDNDQLIGGAGNDTLDGGEGRNKLSGGSGDDEYLLNGFGEIQEIWDSAGANDVIRIGGIREDITFERSGDYLFIKMEGGSAAVRDFFSGTDVGRIEKLIFLDGAEMTWADVVKAVENLPPPNPDPKPDPTPDPDPIPTPQPSPSPVPVGTKGNDVLIGTAGNDTLWADSGDDTLDGGAGDDELLGADGNDVYKWAADRGSDRIFDSGGSDMVVIDALPTDVSLSRDPNDPTTLIITLNGQTLTIIGYFLQGETSGVDTHIETIAFSNGESWSLEDVNSRLGAPDDKLVVGTDDDEMLYGGAGNDTLDGGAGNDLLEGGLGNDVYCWGAGKGIDVVRDYGGNDTIKIDATPDQLQFFTHLSQPGDYLVITLGDRNSSDQLIVEGFFNPEAYKNGQIEKIVFSNGVEWTLKDVLAVVKDISDEDPAPEPEPEPNPAPTNPKPTPGTDGDDYLIGTDGDDILEGKAGHDTLDGGKGIDLLLGGIGDDVYVWRPDTGEDLILDEGGLDTLLVKSSSTDAVVSRDPNDLTTLILSIDGQSIRLNHYFVTGDGDEHESHIEWIVFDDGIAWSLNEVLARLGEKPGPTPTDPTPDPDPEPDPGEDPDEPSPEQPTGSLIIGTAGNDTLIGGIGDDTLDGGAGDDVLKGHVGNDTYRWSFGSGHDTIGDAGGEDSVAINANASEATFARAGDDRADLVINLHGETLVIDDYFNLASNGGYIEHIAFLDQVLEIDDIWNALKTGTDGDDTIWARSGKDQLKGGSGKDVFTFSSAAEAGKGKGRDVILDFNAGLDKIDLSGIDANTRISGDNAFGKLLSGKAKFTKAGQLRYDAKTGILYGNTDKDAAAEFEIQLKNKPHHLKLSDFIL